ncbi:DsbA family oxidoreductase [Alteribacter natronophilus]|uniref:DsbA family oxidoreductase n=1 Tax=Alteribacter natronophilus TaxID=2583810 RepID=UPI00110D2D5E|nr:DsbA family oxidoreductase [Alteribacter natronophilus]TMW72052.1 DsbA family oxidoreductase [Alteribacter natronophilus]
MKIDIWSDFVCPFCYIGKRHLEKALEQFEGRDRVNITYRSFQLDPGASAVAGRSMYDVLSEKYGMTIEQAKQTTANVSMQAEQAGLSYDFDSMIPANTEAAHRLAQFAAGKGKGESFTERVMQAVFSEGEDISDRETLIRLASEAEIDAEQAAAILDSGDYRKDVEEDQHEASAIGVKGVPFFVFDGKYAVSGAQPPERLLEVMEKVSQETGNESNNHLPKEGQECSDDHC